MPDAATCTLDDLVEVVNDKVGGGKDASKPYVGLEQMAEGSPYLLGTLPASASVSTNGEFRPGDLLFGKLRPNLKKCVLVNFAGYCSTDILVLRPRQDVVPGYAAKVFQWEDVFDNAARTAEGTKMPRTSWKRLREFTVPARNKEQQRRIANVLDAADMAIHRTEAATAKLRFTKVGLLQGLLTRGLDSSTGIRPVAYDPLHFREVSIGEIAPQSTERGFPGLPTVSVTMRDGLRPRDTSERRVDTQLSAQQHLLARKGDIAYNMMRMWQGACGLADYDSLLSPAYVVVRPTGVVPAFLYRLFKEPQTIQAFHSKSRGLTDDRLRLYYRDFATIRVRIPRDLEEQRRIADIIAVHDERIRAEEAALDKLKLQKRGLMHDLLTGRVPV